MNHSTPPISASSASSLISQDIASNVRNPKDQPPNLLETGNQISDTLETLDRESDGTSDWKHPAKTEQVEHRPNSTTGDALDLTG